MVNNTAADMESKGRYVDDWSLLKICDKATPVELLQSLKKWEKSQMSLLMIEWKYELHFADLIYFKNINPTFNPLLCEQIVVNKTKLLGITVYVIPSITAT